MLFSIVIPVYNVGEFLVPCLSSVLKQKGSWECILVDDGSCDGSETVCDEFAEKDARFRVIHQENHGVGAARNIGLEAARGEWIWFVDADDIIHPSALELLSRVIETTDAEYIYFDYLYGETIHFDEISQPERTDIVRQTERMPEMSQWRCIFRKSLAGDLRFEDFVVGEDLLFCAKLAVKTEKIYHYPAALYGYFNRRTSVMHSQSFRKTQDEMLWLGAMLEFYHDSDYKYYSHWWRHSWNMFFWGAARKIVQHPRSEISRLRNIWFETLSGLNFPEYPRSVLLLRSIYLFGGRCPVIRTGLIYWNACVFILYAKLIRTVRK